MKYSKEIIIDLPREEVVKLFDSEENMYKWMEGLQSTEQLEGTPGQVGAKMKLSFKMGKREIDMVETITHRNLPEEFLGTYEAKGMWNEVRNHFKDEGDKTRWVLETEFKPDSFMLKLMMTLAPGMFKKQTYKNMQAFKRFVEGQK